MPAWDLVCMLYRQPLTGAAQQTRRERARLSVISGGILNTSASQALPEYQGHTCIQSSAAAAICQVC